METFGNVIALRTGGKTPHFDSADEELQKVLDPREEATFIEKARDVLAEMEELWEQDHNNVEMRDKFHLLRYYLVRLPRPLSTESPSK